MLDRLTKVQLTIFAIVTVLTVGAISIFYLHVPSAVGIGAYKVDANFVAGGGIYQNANVTYRGVTVGRVESVGLTNDGVVAHMRLNSGTPVPDNVTATVKSVSAVGEQYIDLVPPDKPSSAKLRNGASIGQDRTAIGQDIAGLLDEADRLVASVGDTRIKDLLRESFNAFNGSGPELARMIESSRMLVDEANANYGQVDQLIDQAGPFLDAQIRGGDDIKSLSEGLARLTGHVADADPQLRSTLQTVPGATQAANETFTGIRPSFPVLAANLANFGRIGVIYSKSLEQALVIFPALMAALGTVAGGVPADEGGKLDFKIHLQDPPPCTTGFIPPSLIRSPADTTLRDIPPDLYCKTAQNDPSVVRGARNYPCQEFPGKRAPTIQLCRDPKGYVPIGSNPWRGPPVPYGSEPIDEPSDDLCRRTSFRSSRRRWTPTRARRWCSCRRAWRRDRVRRRTARTRCRFRRTSPVRCRRRSRSTRRRTRRCPRTGGRRLRLPGSRCRCRGNRPRTRRPPTPLRCLPRRRRRRRGRASPRYDKSGDIRRPGRGNWRIRGWS